MTNRKIGALWSKKTSEGKEYFSGVISDLRGEIQIVAFKNDKKENENQPDYDILLSEPKEQEKWRQKPRANFSHTPQVDEGD